MITDIKIIAEERTQPNKKSEFPEEIIRQCKTYFFGVRFDNLTKANALMVMRSFLEDKGQPKSRKIFFTNVHTMYLAQKNPMFAQIVNSADLVLPDGSGLKIAGRIFSKRVKENLNGTDFTPLILETAEQLGCKVYLLGATIEVLAECVYKLVNKYPKLDITGFHSGYLSGTEEEEVISEIKTISPDILFIAMGSPTQEIFADKISSELKNTVCIAVGGFFDFISGEKKRAPLLLRKTGLEWLFRFFQDPKTKWDRVVIEIPFFLLSVITSRLFTNKIYSSIDNRYCVIR